MYCRQCGFSNDKYSKMCKRCGSDLTRPVGEYTPQPTEPGKLRFAPKKESFTDRFKRRFRRLERAALNKNRLKPMIITAACVLVLAAALIVVPRIRACLTVVPDTYGDTASNVATQSAAAINGDYLYCSQPVGDNPGLYRVRMSTGELLKISWHSFTEVSWYDGWLYGMDETGTFMRVSGDGLVVQQVLEEKNVRCASLYNGCVYYLDQTGAIFRASLEEVDGTNLAPKYMIKDAGACEMVIFNGMIYYIVQTDICFMPGLPMDSVIDPEYEPGKISRITGKEIPPAYRVDAAQPEKPVGHVYRMLPDGTGEELLIDEAVCNLSAYGDYLYYMTQTVNEVSAQAFDSRSPASIVIRASSCQFWRFNLVTMKYTRFLDEGTARSPLNVTDKGICFISVDGDLETCPVVGGDHSLLPTETQNIDCFGVINGKAYFTADSGHRVGWVDIDSKLHTTLWEAEWDSVVHVQPSATDVSASDAVSSSDAASSSDA